MVLAKPLPRNSRQGLCFMIYPFALRRFTGRTRFFAGLPYDASCTLDYRPG
jgi:hypothetical protein